MLPRRFLQSLNSLSKNKLNSISGSRNVSTHLQISNLRLKNNKHLFSKGYKHCRICNVVSSRFLNTSNIIGPDNIVSTPYGNVDIPNSLLHEFAWESLEKWPENVAIECGITGRNYTYSQLRNRCKEFAASLLKSGFKPGDVISIMLPNIPEFPIALYGAVEAGLIVSTVNPTYTPDELFHQLVDSNSIAVITFADKIDVAQAAKLKLEEKTKGALSLKIISVQEYDGKSRSCPQGVWSLKEMINNNIDTSILSSVNVKSKPTDVVCLPYSSGTTGLPKGVCLTHQNLVSNVTQIKEKDIEQIMTSYGDFQDVLPAILPFFHIFGLNVVLNTALNNGAKLVTLPKFEPELFFKVLKEHKTTIFYIVPPLVLFLTAHPAVTKELLQYVRFVCSGAAPIGATDIERFLTKVPDSSYFLQGYGLTETSPVALLPNNKNRNLSSVGHPVPLTKVKVIDENGKALGIGELGELCITGPQIMKEYLNRPQATAETIKDGWFLTGDIGYYDKDGYFYVVDRKKELIKVKGFQVAPAELEELLRNHPQIADVAVIGVPDARSGELPVAYVVPKPGQEQVSIDNIKKFVAEKVTEYKQLSKVIITPAIPKSASGKILRKDLKASYLEANK